MSSRGVDYVALKNFIADLITPANTDAIVHAHVGMAILLLARLITRRSLATPVPLTCVIALQVAWECAEALHRGAWLWGDTLADTFNTLLWPTILFIGLRLRGPRDASMSENSQGAV